MARPLRLEFSGALYHVTSRGNRQEAIYETDTDRENFLTILSEVCKRYHWLCHAYCLMDNHYHLLIETPEGNLSQGMRQLNGKYTQSFNRTHQRAGHVFQGRYKAILVDKDSYMLELCRYIVLNPVRAGMVRSAKDWQWSSYRAMIGLKNTPEWLETDGVLSNFAGHKAEAVKAYKHFVSQGRGQASPWEALRNQVFLGNEHFVESMQCLLSNNQKIF